jgi:hypothetical protein
MPYDQSLSRAILASELPLTASPLLYINGFPDVGKLTISLGIVKLLGFDKCVLLESHTLIEPLNAQYFHQHPYYQKARKLERERQFEAVAKESRVQGPDHHLHWSVYLTYLSVCFTNLNVESRSNIDWEVAIAAAFVNAAQEARRPFLSIVLTRDLKENLRRLVYEERKQSGTRS